MAIHKTPVLTGTYRPLLGLRETQRAIKTIKDEFETCLTEELRLTRVSAPLFVPGGMGLNDTLTGVEAPVTFRVKGMGDMEIVQSLAKWKRMALGRYGFLPGEGLYTDMNAIRPQEEVDSTHSIYVDQWDWERVLRPQERTLETLKEVVRAIYQICLKTEAHISCVYPVLDQQLPEKITFVTAQELENEFPALAPS